MDDITAIGFYHEHALDTFELLYIDDSGNTYFKTHDFCDDDETMGTSFQKNIHAEDFEKITSDLGSSKEVTTKTYRLKNISDGYLHFLISIKIDPKKQRYCCFSTPLFLSETAIDSKHGRTNVLLPFNHLSKREQQILVLVCKGKTNHQIATQLFISIHTVTKHRQNIAKKMNFQSKRDWIDFAIDQHLI